MFKPNTSVDGIQAAQHDIKRALQEVMTDRFVTVGIHEDAGAHPEGGITNAQLGAVQHFGTQHIPARPWLDVGVASGNADYIDLIVDGMQDGTPPEQILEQVGVVAVGKVQEFMTELSDPPNAKSTIKRKGTDNPLIDDGHLRQAVTYKIVTGEPEEGL